MRGARAVHGALEPEPPLPVSDLSLAMRDQHR